MQNTFPFDAMKETHEPRKTKLDIDEFRSRTANITLLAVTDPIPQFTQ
jgi:hypothetical protein